MTIYGRNITDNDMNNIATYMDNEIRERIHSKFAPCSPDEFLEQYLKEVPEFIHILEREFKFKA